MYRPENTPTAVAVGLLTFGGGALLLSRLLGIWIAFSIVVAAAIGIATCVDIQRRRTVQREHVERNWKRILWEEWGYRDE
jgi:hypothetical protein